MTFILTCTSPDLFCIRKAFLYRPRQVQGELQLTKHSFR